MAFRFPLATVLRVKESIEKREERALQRIQLEMARVARKIEEIDEGIAKARREREQTMQQTMPAGQLQTMLWEAQSALESRKALVQALQTLEHQRDKQVKIYQAAHREHETLINLKREKRELYDLDQTRAQQKYLDDIFMARRHRN